MFLGERDRCFCCSRSRFSFSRSFSRCSCRSFRSLFSFSISSCRALRLSSLSRSRVAIWKQTEALIVSRDHTKVKLWGAKENRSKNSLSKRGCKFKTFLVKVTFICQFIKNHFDNYSFAFSLALKQRLGQLGNSLITDCFQVTYVKSVHNALIHVCDHDSVKKDLAFKSNIHENKINLILINRAHCIPKRTCSSLSGNQYKQGVVFVFLNRLSNKLPAFFWSSSSSSTSAAGLSSTTLEKRHKNTTLSKRIVASLYHPPHDPIRLHNQLVCYTAVFASSLCRLRWEERGGCVTTQRTAVRQTTEPAVVQKMSGRLRFPPRTRQEPRKPRKASL